jgi:hypothetical protein
MDTKPCSKCGKLINSINIILHEGMCNGPINLIEPYSPPEEINRISPQINDNEINTTNFIGLNSNLQNNISDINMTNNINNTTPQTNQDEDFYHCAKCDIYLDIKDREDHILCHQYENQIDIEGEEQSEEEGDSVQSEDHIRNYQHRNFPRINSNIYNNNYENISSRNQISENFNLNSNSSSSVSNMISYNNGVRTETTTTVDPQGRVTTITRTYNSGNSNNSNNQNNLNNNNNFNFGDFSSEEDDDFFGIRRRPLPRTENINNLNQFIGGRMGGTSGSIGNHHPITIFSNRRDLEAFFQHVLQGINPEHPVDAELLDLLPEITIEDTEKLPSEKRDCVVCLTNYEVNDKVLILPCTHLFHTKCIKDWFKSQNTCPICKYKIDKNNMDANQ